jgi:serine/threonine-protein kinase
VLCERYEVIEKIAEGAVATVYRAHDQLAGQPVALKVLDPLRGADPVGHLRFQREFEVLRRISHPHVSRCFALERHGELDFLVLELIEGEPLAAELARGRLSIPRAVAIALQLADALDACHRAGVLHRDLKPSNIVIHPERGAIVLDFGVAWFSSAANLTRTGAVVGSPRYLAPEVFRSSLFDARADLYSLGAILFELLAGRPVYFAESVAELVAAHGLGPPALAALRPEVGPALGAIVATAIAPRPEDRFATARELGDALRCQTALVGGALQARLPCGACGTPLIIDLAFCPGCGREVSWDLAPGHHAVQLTRIASTARCAEWLRARYPEAVVLRPEALRTRLERTPVPLAVDVSPATAEQLAAEAREAGAEPEILRARAFVGARIDPSAATPVELIVAAGLHLVATVGLGKLGIALGATLGVVAAAPVAVSLLGVILARIYTRRPLLRHQRRASLLLEDESERVRSRLARLETERGRRLAASAVARAAPILTAAPDGLPAETRGAIHEALDAALDAALAMDAQAAYLEGRSRSQLAQELAQAESQAALGDPAALDTLARLRQERGERVQASLAHDLAARQALEAIEHVSALLRTRSSLSEVNRAIGALEE